MKKSDKKKRQKSHAKARAVQRYGVELKDKDYQEICGWIKSGGERVVFLDKQSNRVSLWGVWWNDIWLPIVYDKDRNSIASVLPKEALLPYVKKLEQVELCNTVKEE